MRGECVAAAGGEPEAYPLPKAAAKKSDVHHAVVVVRDAAGRVLLEKRPEKGLWAGMWQPVGVEDTGRPPGAGDLARELGAEGAERLAELVHETSHRTVRLSVWWAAAAGTPERGRWVEPGELGAYALPNPHRRALRAVLKNV